MFNIDDECQQYDDECQQYDDECPNSLVSIAIIVKSRLK